MIRLVSASESSLSSDLCSFMSWPIDYDPKDFKRLKLPKVSAKALREIGRFMVMWGVVEDQLDVLITAIYRLEPTFALTITASLNTKAKVEMLRSAFNMLRDPLGKDFVSEADGLFIEVANLANGTRNVIAHGRMQNVDELDPISPSYIRYSARKQLEMIWYTTEAKLWKEKSEYAKKLALSLRQMVPHVVETVKGLTAEELHRLCVSR